MTKNNNSEPVIIIQQCQELKKKSWQLNVGRRDNLSLSKDIY